MGELQIWLNNEGALGGQHPCAGQVDNTREDSVRKVFLLSLGSNPHRRRRSFCSLIILVPKFIFINLILRASSLRTFHWIIFRRRFIFSLTLMFDGLIGCNQKCASEPSGRRLGRSWPLLYGCLIRQHVG